MHEITISVILPVYNAENTLKVAIESVLSYRGNDIELVIVNDGSKDNSEYIVKEYIDDSRVSYYYQENKGVSTARNVGLSNAKGKYIAFLDSDDFFTKGAFERIIEMVNSDNGDIIGFGFYEEDIIKNKTIKTECHTISDNYSLKIAESEDLFKYVFSSSKILYQTSWNKIFKRSIIEQNNIRFNTELVCYENLTFFYNYIMFCDTISFYKDVLYFHRRDNISESVLIKRRSDNLTANVSVCMRAFLEVCKKNSFSKEYEQFMLQHFFEAFTYCSKKIFIKETNKTYQERKKMFKDLLNDKMFLYLYNNYINHLKFYQLIFILKKNKLLELAYIVYKKKIM